jgi:hypothetical protein
MISIAIGASTAAQADDLAPGQRRWLKESFEIAIRSLATAATITDHCPSFEYTAQIGRAFGLLAQLAERAGITEDVAIRLALARFDALQLYGHERDPRGFCARILADWGPASVNPVVQRRRQ